MNAPSLHDLHQRLHAVFTEVNGMEMVGHYGDPMTEYRALQQWAGVLDLSARGRLCLTGPDRQRFLNGQVTNNVKELTEGRGCYAAVVNAKGKMECDLDVYCLSDELLLDFEPGYSASLSQRFEKYIIADDVEVIDAAPHYALFSVQGPGSARVLHAFDPSLPPPSEPMTFVRRTGADHGEIYCMNRPRGVEQGFDLYIPAAQAEAAFEKLAEAARGVGGRPCGWQALEMSRIEAGIPRFGQDMDETNLPPEAGLDARAISYTKGCYIGQEVIARIRTYGQVAKALRGLRLADDLQELPRRGDRLFVENRDAGYVTSTLASPAFQANLALGYVRREHHQPGTQVVLRSATGESLATVLELPFARSLKRQAHALI